MLEGVISDDDIQNIVNFTGANEVLEQERKRAKCFITRALS
jgi:hypothetical protein